MNLWVVVLAGGVGSRFWPLSTPSRPKQLLPLVGDRSLLEDTLGRLAPLVGEERTLVLTNAQLADRVRASAPLVPHEQVIAEPKPAGTAAALAFAAMRVRELGGEDAVMLCVHADWAIGDDEGFRDALRTAAAAAATHSALVTVGIQPTRPDIGYGYIEPGEQVAPGVRRVARFREKPDLATAERLCAEGCLWNSGIFAWRAADFLAEVRGLTPELSRALEIGSGNPDEFFAAVTSPVSVDVGVLERSERVMVVDGTFGWDDVGTWASLGRVRRRDECGNAVYGRVHALDASDNVVHAENNAIVLFGVSDLVVVEREGITLVTTREHAASLKTLLDSLPDDLREPA
jgi:mannose-1-phosphate guanylyltransferase